LAKKSYGLSKEERLRKARDFLRIKREGRKLSSANFLILYRKNHLAHSRLGVAVKKELAISVKRNRMKRLLREFFRLNKAKIMPGLDILILPKKDISHLKYQEVERELGAILFVKSV
jgi:ribonuclease P protein component